MSAKCYSGQTFQKMFLFHYRMAQFPAQDGGAVADENIHAFDGEEEEANADDAPDDKLEQTE